MKIDVNTLRKLVKEVLMEEMNTEPVEKPTVPAPKSAGEQQFKKDVGDKWGSPKAIPRSNPNQKNARVYTLVMQTGLGANMDNAQRQNLKKEIDTFLDAKDPSEKLIATAENLADEFMKSKKSAPSA